MIGTRPYQLCHRSGYTTGHIGFISIDENVIEIKNIDPFKKIQLHVSHKKYMCLVVCILYFNLLSIYSCNGPVGIRFRTGPVVIRN